MSKNIVIFQIAYSHHYLNIFNLVYGYNRKNIFPDDNVDFVLFTDQKGFAQDGVIVEEVEEDCWPFICLQKIFLMKRWLEENNKYKEYDFAYYIDVDNFVASSLPENWKTNMIFFTTWWNDLFAGGFYGGKAEAMLSLLKDMEPEASLWNDDCFLANPHYDEFLMVKSFNNIYIEADIYKWADFIKWQDSDTLKDLKADGDKCVIQLNKNSKLVRGYDRLITHDNWTDYCIFNEKRKIIVRNVEDSISIAKLKDFDGKRYSLEWNDSSELSFFYPKENRISTNK